MRDRVELRVLLAPTHSERTFWVPLDLSVVQAAALISRLFERDEPALWRATGGEDLMPCDAGGAPAGELLNPNESLRALKASGAPADGFLVSLS